jgi:predicted transcriptional regulator
MMPIRKYNDEELRPKAVELRKQGLSYAQIARRLGCSPGKVHQLIGPLESTQARLKQLAEIDRRIEELRSRLHSLANELEDLRKDAESLSEAVDADLILKMRTFLKLLTLHKAGRPYKCVHVDDEGFCKYYRFPSLPDGVEFKEVFVQDEDGNLVRKYLVNVRKGSGRALCVLCPSYEPKNK